MLLLFNCQTFRDRSYGRDKYVIKEKAILFQFNSSPLSYQPQKEGNLVPFSLCIVQPTPQFWELKLVNLLTFCGLKQEI